MPAQPLRTAVLLLSIAAFAGCGSRSSSTQTRSTLPTAPTDSLLVINPLSVSNVRLSGNLTLRAVGDTSQMSATATFSDGTTRDVTNESRWTSSDAAVLTVSTTGLITAVQLGRARVAVNYQVRNTSAIVNITPPGTFIASGRVREPGFSGLGGVLVTDVVSGRYATSDSQGSFAIASVPVAAGLRFQKDGYETVSDVDVTDIGVDVPLQKIIRLSAGEKAEPPPLAPHDVEYTIGSQRCQPCRRIRVVVGSRGTLEVKASAAPEAVLFLPNGRTMSSDTAVVTAEITVTTPGEVVLYFGLPGTTISKYIKFTIETQLRQ
jgi:Bacterial Ig-like domain (group 2)